MKIKTFKTHQFINEGSGTPLILLHGLMGGLSNFNFVITYFSKKYKVIVPLLPIYTLPVITTNAKSITKYLHTFISDLNLNNFILLGNSLGGHIALLYNKYYTPQSSAMILTGSSGLYEKSMGDSFPQRSNYDYIQKKTEEVFYNPKNATKELVDEVFETVNNREKVIRIIMLAKSAIRHNMSKDLPNLIIPTCLIWGKQDAVTPPKVAENFHLLLPNSQLYWIDECGHAAMMEQPKTFNNLVEKWLKRYHT